MHAAFQYGIPNSFGVEIDRVKVQKSTAFLSQTMRSMATKGYDMNAIALPRIECAPIEVVPTLEPATHLYSFWEGIPWEAREAVGRLVAESRTIRGIAVVQRAMRGVAPEAEVRFGSSSFARQRVFSFLLPALNTHTSLSSHTKNLRWTS